MNEIKAFVGGSEQRVCRANVPDRVFDLSGRQADRFHSMIFFVSLD